MATQRFDRPDAPGRRRSVWLGFQPIQISALVGRCFPFQRRKPASCYHQAEITPAAVPATQKPALHIKPDYCHLQGFYLRLGDLSPCLPITHSFLPLVLARPFSVGNSSSCIALTPVGYASVSGSGGGARWCHLLPACMCRSCGVKLNFPLP